MLISYDVQTAAAGLTAGIVCGPCVGRCVDSYCWSVWKSRGTAVRTRWTCSAVCCAVRCLAAVCGVWRCVWTVSAGACGDRAVPQSGPGGPALQSAAQYAVVLGGRRARRHDPARGRRRHAGPSAHLWTHTAAGRRPAQVSPPQRVRHGR